MDHTVLPANTPCLPFLRMRSPDGATSNWGKRHLIAAYCSSIDPKGMKGWVGLVSWPIADGIPTLSGHASATGQAQDRESTPAENQRSTTEPRNQPKQWLGLVLSNASLDSWHKKHYSLTLAYTSVTTSDVAVINYIAGFDFIVDVLSTFAQLNFLSLPHWAFT